MSLSFNQPCIATIHGCGIHVSGGVLVPQLACELSIFRFGSVTQYGIDVGAKRVSIRRRRHERVVEVQVHLAEERMEPELFTGATGVSAARSVPTPRTTLARMSRYVFARSR